MLALLVVPASACAGRSTPVVAPSASPSRGLDPLRRDIERVLDDPALEHGTWTVLVRSLDRSDTLYALNPGKLMIPASAMKLVTLAAVADRLGWDHTYRTDILGVGAVDFGFLDGDLLVVGSGDPTLDDWDGAATSLFQTWADRLKALGVRAIGGRIIGDDNAFDDEGLGPGWAWDDLGAGYAAPVGALQYNQNTARVSILPGPVAGVPPDVQLVPPNCGLTIRSFITTVNLGDAAGVTVQRSAGSGVVELRGSVPASGGAVVRNVAVDNPTLYFVSALREALEANGIEVRGPAVDIDLVADPPARSDGQPFIAHRSPPLASIAETMMTVSQNLYAETLLKTIAAAAPGTLTGGRIAARSTLEAWGLTALDVQMVDGSGLSRYNLLTAHALVTILERAHRNPRLGDSFAAALPTAGKAGTLAERMKGTAAEGNVRAKTGSLSNARSLAGYVRTPDGEALAFAMIANHYGTPPEVVERAMDAMAARLAGFRR
jgi:D-alanyl-D-alanine carboxypeptidase/D-alanyl-D-alanine-endopeptidase (penicillin-binding protein 4)